MIKFLLRELRIQKERFRIMKLRFDSRKEELLIRKEELLTAMDEFSLNLSIMIIKYFLYIFFFSAVFCELGFAEVPGFFTVGI